MDNSNCNILRDLDVSTFAIAENLNWNKNVSDYQMEILD